VRVHALLPGGIASIAAFAILLVALLFALGIANHFDSTSQRGPEIDELAFAKRLHRIAGPTAVTCGFVRLKRANPEAVKCRDDALAKRRPFIYAFKSPYWRAWNGLVVDPSGDSWMVWYDHENPARGSMQVMPCTPLLKDARFSCQEHAR
jgi:hypothetical protein